VRYAAILMIGFLILIGGCGENEKSLEKIDYKEETRRLTLELASSKDKSAGLEGQIAELTKISDTVKASDIYELKSLSISKLTNIYDDNDNGIKDTLLVYIKPTDIQGDTIKAAGQVEIQVWDLNNEQGQALLFEKQIGAGELKDLWFGQLTGPGYRFKFDVSKEIPSYTKPLTVKVKFVGLLTGKIFDEQKVITPR